MQVLNGFRALAPTRATAWHLATALCIVTLSACGGGGGGGGGSGGGAAAPPPPAPQLSLGPATCSAGSAGDVSCEGISLHKRVPLETLQETACFDTYPASNDAALFGAWSVYPYLPSGTIIVSDVNNGLFVLSIP